MALLLVRKVHFEETLVVSNEEFNSISALADKINQKVKFNK